MPRFVIHVGPHKTGSTFLQSALAELGAPLAARGVLWPQDLGAKGHETLPRLLSAPDQREIAAERIESCLRSGYETIVLSAEDLSRLQPEPVEAFGRMLGDNAVQIVFYCRPWGQVALSQWNQHIRNGFTTPLNEMMRRHLDRPRHSGPLNYGAKLDRWAAVFGPAALRLVCLEALADSGTDTLSHFADRFLTVSGLPAPAAAGVSSNPSSGVIDTEIIRALNQIGAERQAEADSRLASRYLKARLTLDLGCVVAAMQRCRDSVEFDEAAPALRRLHRRLHATYGNAVVPPRLDGRFFTPGARAMSYIRPDYLLEPGVTTALRHAYRSLTAAT